MLAGEIVKKYRVIKNIQSLASVRRYTRYAETLGIIFNKQVCNVSKTNLLKEKLREQKE